MKNAEAIIDDVATWEHRGPTQSLIRVNGTEVEVVRNQTDYADVIGDKPYTRATCENIADLLPSAREMLRNSIKSVVPNVSGGSDFTRMR